VSVRFDMSGAKITILRWATKPVGWNEIIWAELQDFGGIDRGYFNLIESSKSCNPVKTLHVPFGDMRCLFGRFKQQRMPGLG